jgi:hypothetical protein
MGLNFTPIIQTQQRGKWQHNNDGFKSENNYDKVNKQDLVDDIDSIFDDDEE